MGLGMSPWLPEQIQLRRRFELLQLGAIAMLGRRSDIAFRGEFGFFEVSEDRFRAVEDGVGHAGQSGDLDEIGRANG